MSTAIRDVKRKAKTIKSVPVRRATRTPMALRTAEAPKRVEITRQPYQRRRKFNLEYMVKAVQIALQPDTLIHHPEKDQLMLKAAADAVTRGASIASLGGNRGQRGGFANGRTPGTPQPIPVVALAQEAARALAPSAGTTPADIEVALRRQGIDWVMPFAPGRPLTPYYGYNRRLRQMDYRVGRNITTDTRPDRLPFSLLKQLNEGYDIASICIRHLIQDMRAMKLSFGPMDSYDGDVSKEIIVAKQFLRRPDGNRPFPVWLAQWMMDNLRYDAGCLARERNAAGKLIALKVVDGTTVAPIVDYFGDRPIPPAPFLQQFVQGVPWDWATTDDVIYEPHWPLPESPYGVAPAETIVLNANTDVRLQLFFLQFFTAGVVPEMLIEAPLEMTDPDAVAELQEDWDNFYESNQTGRHGAHWVPAGSKPHPYKPDKFDPNLAEYVMRRSVAAFGLVPQDLGFTETVNRATAEAQADTQFRISTLPNTEVYEAILNMVIQDDLQLPIQVNFDTGREKKDRLMEAQAHQIYVGIGAESVDEVRDQILGLPVDNDNRIPRFWESPRLGPTPLIWIQSVSGKIDPSTLSPFEVPPAQPFVPLEGQKGPASTQADPTGSKEKPQQALPASAASGAEPPIMEAGTAIPKGTSVSKPGMREKDTHEQVGDMHTDPEGRIQGGVHGLPTVKLQGAAARNEFRVDDGALGVRPSSQERESRPRGSSSPSGQMGSSISTRGSTSPPRRAATGNALRKSATGGITSATAVAGIDPATLEDEDDSELFPEVALKELALWRHSALKKAKNGKQQRRWISENIPPEVLDHVHQRLQNAKTADEVDKVFESTLSKTPVDAPRDAPQDPGLDAMDVHQINGLALRAADTGRVLMLQRAITKGDPAAGMWEFPGGHKRFYESEEEGAVREWEEETGIRFPKKAQLYSNWDSFNGRYRGWVYEIPSETDIKLDGREEIKNPDGDYFEAVAWFNPDTMSRNPDIRPELLADVAILQNALKWPRKKALIGPGTRKQPMSGLN